MRLELVRLPRADLANLDDRALGQVGHVRERRVILHGLDRRDGLRLAIRSAPRLVDPCADLGLSLAAPADTELDALKAHDCFSGSKMSSAPASAGRSPHGRSE